MRKLLFGSLAAIGMGIAVPLTVQAYPITQPPVGYRASGTPVEGRYCYSTRTDSLYYCYDRALNSHRISRTFGQNALVIGPKGEQYENNGFFSSEYRASTYYGANPNRVVSPTPN